MNEVKQIEEMAKDICDYARGEICILDDKKCDMQCTSAKIAKKLTAKGYRKQSVGEWMEVDDGVLIGDGKHLECSKCGVWKKDKQKSNFCPNCGAKMKGESK